MSTQQFKHLGQIGIEQLIQLLHTEFGLYVKIVDGMGLSQESFTTEEKQKLSNIAAEANKYEHDKFNAAAKAFYKVQVNEEGHVVAVEAVTKEDIVALGVPAQDTTYVEATADKAGLLPAADKVTIDALKALAFKDKVAEADLEDALKEKVNAAAEGNHAHLNKELLDTYTQTEANLADAVAKKHEHANKAELDLIATGDKAKWDAAVTGLAEEITRAKAAEQANATAASNAQAKANTNEAAITKLNADENTAGSVANTVKSYVDAKVASAYKAAGSVAFADLPAASAANEGYVYNMSDDFTTTADFVEGAGKAYKAGTNVAIVEISEGVFKYDVLAMSFDGFVQEANVSEYTADEVNALWNNVFGA